MIMQAALPSTYALKYAFSSNLIRFSTFVLVEVFEPFHDEGVFFQDKIYFSPYP